MIIIKITTKDILKVLYVIAWIIFVGVGIEAGGLIVQTIGTLVMTPEDARLLWRQVDLSALFSFDKGYYLVEMLLISIVAVLRACLFYLIIKMLHDKKLNLSQPFSKEVRRFILRIGYLALLIGVFSWRAVAYAAWFTEQGVKIPDVQYLGVGGADVWLFMAVTLFVIAQIFKRGIEIQSEHELTV